jgi:hypothetical protein
MAVQKKEDTKPAKSPAPSRKVLGGAAPRNREAMEAAGMKRGGAVKKPGAGRYC